MIDLPFCAMAVQNFSVPELNDVITYSVNLFPTYITRDEPFFSDTAQWCYNPTVM